MSKAGAQDAVIVRGRSTTLDIPQDRGPNLKSRNMILLAADIQSLKLLGKAIGRPRESNHFPWLPIPKHTGSLAIGDGPLGDHHNRGEMPSIPALLDLLQNQLRVIGDLGEQDDVSGPSDARVKCQPPCVPPHHLYHDGAIVA